MDLLTMRESVELIEGRLDRHEFTQHVVVNVAKIVQARSDAGLRRSIASCEMINIDGMGVVWGARLLGLAVPERVAGADLFEELIALSARRGKSIFLLGAEPDIVQRVHDRLREANPDLRIAGFHHGFFWDDERSVVDLIAASGAQLLFVAISSPAKERFLNRWREQLGVDFAMGVGGVFDIVAGRTRRAPKWMQKAGLEWLYRLAEEPGRMWKRYLVTNLQFAWLLLRARVGRGLRD